MKIQLLVLKAEVLVARLQQLDMLQSIPMQYGQVLFRTSMQRKTCNLQSW